MVRKTHTVVHYTLVGTTHGGTQQLQQCTIHTVVHDTRTLGLAEGQVICLALMVVVTPENTTNYVTI